jgi:hypothetical protein
MQQDYFWFRLIEDAKSPKTDILRERRFIPKKDLNWRHPLTDKNWSPIGWFN